MRLKLYRASIMAEAMARIRSELGEDALILATRRVGDGVEVTAALEPEGTPLPPVLDAVRIDALTYHGVPPALQMALQKGELEEALAAVISFASLPLEAGAPPLILVGPPGAGKTLTAAKLAARLVIAGLAPMVITADGQRAGATEQLAAFTKLLGINLIVACHPVTLGRALTRRQQNVPVVIDTPGCDAFAPAQLEEIAALAATVSGTTILVLPAGLDAAEATDIARAHAAFGTRLLIATRLDLARRLGGILAAASTGLALTEAGVGPGVADGLQPVTLQWLANRLLETHT